MTKWGLNRNRNRKTKYGHKGTRGRKVMGSTKTEKHTQTVLRHDKYIKKSNIKSL